MCIRDRYVGHIVEYACKHRRTLPSKPASGKTPKAANGKIIREPGDKIPIAASDSAERAANDMASKMSRNLRAFWASKARNAGPQRAPKAVNGKKREPAGEKAPGAGPSQKVAHVWPVLESPFEWDACASKEEIQHKKMLKRGRRRKVAKGISAVPDWRRGMS